jgi:hypothetical protein
MKAGYMPYIQPIDSLGNPRMAEGIAVKKPDRENATAGVTEAIHCRC